MKKKTWIQTTLLCSVVVLMILMIFGGLHLMETAFFSKAGQEEIETKTIVKDGVKYYPRKDICVVMVLGVDNAGKVTPSEEPNHGNAVDMVTLVVFDEKDETVRLLVVNCDTMVEMPRLNDEGRETGTHVARLALSHTYGRGVEDSCINTRTAVSNLMQGIDIDYYLAMNADALPILNDAVGGVTVNVQDDFSQVDPSIQMGEMTLFGEQANTFMQKRKDAGDQLALTRVERQKEYMRGFIEAMQNNLLENSSGALEVYHKASEYIVTDVSFSVLGRLRKDYGRYTISELHSLKGENVPVENGYEFYPDQEALDELVLHLFFKAKE